MTVGTFIDKTNKVKHNMRRRLVKRELRYAKVNANIDDRKMEIIMLDMKGNYLKISHEFKEKPYEFATTAG